MKPGPYVGYLISAIIICVVLALRFRSMRRVQKLRLERLWVVPALYAIVTATELYQSMPQGIQWLYIAIALGFGALLGWRPALRLEEALAWIVTWHKRVGAGGDARAATLDQIAAYRARVEP